MNPDLVSSLLSLLLNIAALVLSLVALLATVIGFFASLKFYRDGTQTQQAVNRLLSKVEAKVESISAQVGGLLETTIKAALHRPTEQAQAQTREVAPTPDPNNPIALLTEEIRKGEMPGATVEKLSTLRALRFTNVSDPIGNLFFALGRDLAFNVFDGAGKV